MEISTKPFLSLFFGEKHDFGHILGTRDFERVCWRDDDIENEDAVQHPRIHLSITFEVLVGDV